MDTASVTSTRTTQSKGPTVILKIMNDAKSETTIEPARSITALSRSRVATPKGAKIGEEVKVYRY